VSQQFGNSEMDKWSWVLKTSKIFWVKPRYVVLIGKFFLPSSLSDIGRKDLREIWTSFVPRKV